MGQRRLLTFADRVEISTGRKAGWSDESVIDDDGDGEIDSDLVLVVIDAVAVNDGGSQDLTYGGTVLTPGYDGNAFSVGGASRIPDGTDSDAVSDWVRNDFDLAGIDGFQGSLTQGEALNTPGESNSLGDPVDPDIGVCGDPATAIGDVQGPGATSPVDGERITIEAVVVGDFQAGGFNGFYVQVSGDGDVATSDGIFGFAPAADNIAVGAVCESLGWSVRTLG